MFYSVVIPVYNRPDEIQELLQSLTKQSYTNFEVIVVEDGSSQSCEQIVQKFSGKLDAKYYYKENKGQGFARNYGFERAKGDYFVMFDSDCIIPEQYFETVDHFLSENPVDCWGGPDHAHPSFTPLQKAINFSMTSTLTTGGIRGRENNIGGFHPRGFNMGISREVFQKTGGFKQRDMGEDIEFSIRMIRQGFSTALIKNAFVYHKRRTNIRQFFWQVHSFGRTRINLGELYPDEIKIVHLFPVLFCVGLIISIILLVADFKPFSYLYLLYILYALALFTTAFVAEKKLKIAALSVLTSFVQLSGYGLGFLTQLWRKYFGR